MSPTEESILTFEPYLKRSTCYAGIGSRLTPASTLELMERIAEVLAMRGLILRSGGAPGADMAFEQGCHQANGKKEIFLPWKGFNGNCSSLFPPSKDAEELAALCHPNGKACTPVARKFHARNCQQVCGQHLDNPVGFVLFWAHERDSVVRGGTATAVYLARQLDVKDHPFSFINRIMRRWPNS